VRQLIELEIIERFIKNWWTEGLDKFLVGKNYGPVAVESYADQHACRDKADSDHLEIPQGFFVLFQHE